MRNASAGPVMTAPRQSLPRQGLILLAVLSLGWGLNWVVIKVALTELPPLYFRAASLLFGGLGLLIVARFTGERTVRVPDGAWGRVLLIALCNTVLCNVLVIYGLTLLPAGRAALLNYTMPLWGQLLSVWLLGETFTVRRVVALGLGLAGIAVLLAASLDGMLQAPIGVACMLGGAWSWALGIVLIKRLPVRLPTTALTGWMLLLGGLPILVAAVPLETAQLVWPSFWPLFGVFYNIVVSCMLCYWAWTRLVLMVPVAVSSLSSLSMPLVGVLGGVVLLGEPFGGYEALAVLLILSAVATVVVKR